MSETKKTPLREGGPAFPIQGWNDGMYMRDYFAGQALVGELASQTVNAVWADRSIHKLAKRCYSIADALLAEREGEER